MFDWLKSLVARGSVMETECSMCQSWQTYTVSSYGNHEYNFLKCDKCGSEGNGPIRERQL